MNFCFIYLCIFYKDGINVSVTFHLLLFRQEAAHFSKTKGHKEEH